MITAAIIACIVGFFGAALESPRVTFASAVVVAICLCARFLP